MTQDERHSPLRWLFYSLTLVGLAVNSRYNFLLFHALVEFFSIIVAGCIFLVAWNTRHLTSNSFLLFLGIAYLAIGSLDAIHTLAYKGMGIFPNSGANPPTQLWIAARGLEAVSLLMATFFIHRSVKATPLALGYGLITGLLLASILIWPSSQTALSRATA